jgi:uncharacterized membrane protein YhaH (DUF805 family)
MNTASHLQGTLTPPMDYRFLFLDPQGRLAPKPFARGLVILTAAFLVVTVLSAVVSPGLGILQYTLVFPYICVFGKRLHDAGLSAWLWLAYAAAVGVFGMVFSAILLPILSPGAFAVQAEIQTVMETTGFAAGFEALSERAEEYARLSAVTSVASFLLASGLVGLAAFRMRSEPKPNRHGPPTSGPAAPRS